MAFSCAVDPSAVSAALPPQFTGAPGALRPCRLLSLPQPVDVTPTITAVDAAAASALRTASSFTDLAFAYCFSPATDPPGRDVGLRWKLCFRCRRRSPAA